MQCILDILHCIFALLVTVFKFEFIQARGNKVLKASLAFSINAYGKFHFTKFEFRTTEKGIHYLWWSLFSA